MDNHGTTLSLEFFLGIDLPFFQLPPLESMYVPQRPSYRFAVQNAMPASSVETARARAGTGASARVKMTVGKTFMRRQPFFDTEKLLGHELNVRCSSDVCFFRKPTLAANPVGGNFVPLLVPSAIAGHGVG